MVGIAAYFCAALYPFRFDFRRPGAFHWVYVTPVNGALNFLCFMPLGFAVAHLSFVHQPVLDAAIVCGSISGIAETLQRFVPGRFSTLSDWLLNVAGGVVGSLGAG